MKTLFCILHVYMAIIKCNDRPSLLANCVPLPHCVPPSPVCPAYRHLGAASPLHLLPQEVMARLLDQAVPRHPCSFSLDMPPQLTSANSDSSSDDDSSSSSDDDDDGGNSDEESSSGSSSSDEESSSSSREDMS